MIKIFNLMLLLVLSGFFPMESAAQTCRSESEIPASTPTGRFTDHGDGTVTDSVTGLMWAKCAEGLSGSDCAVGGATSLNWQVALDLASVSTLAGHSDWRLPNVKELRSIVENQCSNPAINLFVFPHTPTSYFVSASPSSLRVWVVSFQYGESSKTTQYRTNLEHVRLVRSVQ